jgi:uncharacterized membrane protein
MAICLALIAVRCIYIQTTAYVFLAWNLILAFIPLAIAYSIYKFRISNKWLMMILFFTWLFFMPNATYIVTDLVHLKNIKPNLEWFTIGLIFFCALTGLLCSALSLHWMVDAYKQYLTNNTKLPALIIIFLLSGFGIYLGRYLRWNTWDIISNPLGLVHDVADRIIYPLQHLRTWGVTIIYALLNANVYYFIRQFNKQTT